MDSNRIKRVEGQFQKDLSEIMRNIAKEKMPGRIVSITEVDVAPDLSLAKVWVSVLPDTEASQIVSWMEEHKNLIKDSLVRMLKGQMRKMPDLRFILDDRLAKQEALERILKGGGESPIK